MENALFDLQGLDLECGNLAKAIEKMKLELEAARTTLEQEKAGLAGRRDELKQLNVSIRETEGEIEILGKQQKASDEKMLQVTSAKQLDALKAQIESLSARVEEREAFLLDLYEQQESAEKALEESRRRVDQLERDGEKRKSEIEVEIKRAEERIADLVKERSARAERVDPGLLARYEPLRKRYGGRVVFETDDMVCPGCGMALPRPDFNRMTARRDQFSSCANCGRLLIYVGV